MPETAEAILEVNQSLEFLAVIISCVGLALALILIGKK